MNISAHNIIGWWLGRNVSTKFAHIKVSVTVLVGPWSARKVKEVFMVRFPQMGTGSFVKLSNDPRMYVLGRFATSIYLHKTTYKIVHPQGRQNTGKIWYPVPFTRKKKRWYVFKLLSKPPSSSSCSCGYVTWPHIIPFKSHLHFLVLNGCWSN